MISKSAFVITLFFLICILITSCTINIQENTQNERSNQVINNNDLAGFFSMQQTELAEQSKSLEDITKIWFTEYGDMMNIYEVAIDIGNMRMFVDIAVPINPVALDTRAPDFQMTNDDVNEVLAILERNNVLEWDCRYGEPHIIDDDPNSADGSYQTWLIYIQYNDNTISKYEGFRRVYPDNYNAFAEEITAFINSKKDPYDRMWSMFWSENTMRIFHFNNITKIVFVEYTDGSHQSVQIDVNKRLLAQTTDIRTGRTLDSGWIDVAEYYYSMSDADVDDLNGVLFRNQVFRWGEDFAIESGFPNTDDYDGWVLCIQFSDNTVFLRGSNNANGDIRYPENFESFRDEIFDYINSKGS